MSCTRAAIALLLLVGAARGADAPESYSVSNIRARLAWSLLIMGDSEAALRQFTRLAGMDDAAAPKVGCALASADLGDFAGAARAMRRALRTNPESVAAVSIDPRLRPVVDRLTSDSIKWLAGNDGVQQDALLLLASLNYLRGDADSARYAVDLARASGDHSPGTANLDRLIDELQPAPAAEPVPEPMTEPITERAVEPVAEPVPEPVAEPNVQPVAEAPAEPTAAPAPDPSTEQAGPPAPEPEPVPHEPVDFDKLRDDVGVVAGTLDSFTSKLLRAMAEIAREGTTARRHEGTE